MHIDFPKAQPFLEALLDRYIKAAQPQRSEMVLRAIGAMPHRHGWLLRNNRLIPSAAAPYWATDLNAIAAAEEFCGLAHGIYAVLAVGRQSWLATAGEPTSPRFRVRAANERDVRALAVLLHMQLRDHTPEPAARRVSSAAWDQTVPVPRH